MGKGVHHDATSRGRGCVCCAQKVRQLGQIKKAKDMAIESQGVTPILEYISFLFLFLVMLNEGGVIRDYFQQFMTSLTIIRYHLGSN